jgi:hypothetical protein
LPLATFADALAQIPAGRQPHLLLGNGFSRACLDDVFAYDALFDRADFKNLSPRARAAFTALGTTDFEIVMRALWDAAKLMSVYAPKEPDVVEQFVKDAEGLRDVLVHAIADNHPSHPGEITAGRYATCRKFLSHFNKIYTLNYDLLLYWALMNTELGPQITCDDGFRTPEDGAQEYVTWESGRHGQNIYFLHGALHVFDSQVEVQKYTWTNTGVRLIEQIRNALNNDLYPIFVAEGESAQKYERIRHNDFLTKAYRSFQEIGGTLFVYGHSMAPNDDHIIRCIGKGKLAQLFIGLYGDPSSAGNQQIGRKAEYLQDMRPKTRPLDIEYFDAQSAAVWG